MAKLGPVAALFSIVFGSAAFAVDPGVWGIYPACIAPAVPLEVHSWWHEDGETNPRHMHLSGCFPNVRDLANPVVTVSQPTPYTVTVTAFNNPSTFNWVREAWQGDIYNIVNVALRCDANPTEIGPGSPYEGVVSQIGGIQQCQWFIPMQLEPSLMHSDCDELRLSPNINQSGSSLGERHFTTLNPQICDGSGNQSYRSVLDPEGRSWYEVHEYANVRLNYMDFFTSLDQSVPTVSGVVPLQIRHREGSFDIRSTAWLDMNHHLDPTFYLNAQVGVPHSSGGVLLYDVAGHFDGTYDWNTLGLADGLHSLYVQTLDSGPTGSNAGAMKFLFDVQNPDCGDGQDNDGDGGIDFDGGATATQGAALCTGAGSPVACCTGAGTGCTGPADADCSSATDESESAVCGLGAELALLLPLLAWRRGRRDGRSRSPATA